MLADLPRTEESGQAGRPERGGCQTRGGPRVLRQRWAGAEYAACKQARAAGPGRGARSWNGGSFPAGTAPLQGKDAIETGPLHAPLPRIPRSPRTRVSAALLPPLPGNTRPPPPLLSRPQPCPPRRAHWRPGWAGPRLPPGRGGAGLPRLPRITPGTGPGAPGAIRGLPGGSL